MLFRSRRFIAVSNPPLAKLITEKTGGEEWLRDLSHMRQLTDFMEDEGFRRQWADIKLTAKKKLAAIIQQRTGTEVNPESMFDILVKRIHQYKRQHLKALHILTSYLELKKNPDAGIPARTFIFGGKAAPGYYHAKLIIKLITSIAEVINNDKTINNRLKVVFLPDYNVTNAQPVFPAADLSEQISMAGKEASGTGNMKFSMNGALTIGTLDGANVEIREETGIENFFLFGLNVQEVHETKQKGYYPYNIYENNRQLREVIDFIQSGDLSEGNSMLFQPLVQTLLYNDPYMLFADYQSYIDCQKKVDDLWKNRDAWTRMSIINAASMGRFSSDRSIRDYCEEIWNVKPFRR